MRTRSTPTFAIVAALVVASAVQAAEIAGTWSGKTVTPQGQIQVTLVLTKTAAGAYAGTISDSEGMIAPNTELTDVTWADNVFGCAFKLTDGTGVKLTGKLDGARLNSTWVHQGGETGTLVLDKAEK